MSFSQKLCLHKSVALGIICGRTTNEYGLCVLHLRSNNVTFGDHIREALNDTVLRRKKAAHTKDNNEKNLHFFLGLVEA